MQPKFQSVSIHPKRVNILFLSSTDWLIKLLVFEIPRSSRTKLQPKKLYLNFYWLLFYQACVATFSPVLESYTEHEVHNFATQQTNKQKHEHTLEGQLCKSNRNFRKVIKGFNQPVFYVFQPSHLLTVLCQLLVENSYLHLPL